MSTTDATAVDEKEILVEQNDLGVIKESNNTDEQMTSPNTMEDSPSLSCPEQKQKRLARSERKRKHYEELLQQRRDSRKMKKMERKMRQQREKNDIGLDEGPSPAGLGSGQGPEEERKSKKELRRETQLRLEGALRVGQKICVDCSLVEHMSNKEIGKLAMQIGRLYGSNRRASNPAHIYLCGLQREGTLYQECIKKNDGFLNYLIDIEERPHTELFPLDKIVYLSPDSDKALGDIDPDSVYIIGGLVDESITKNISLSCAKTAGITTARLPIDEHMDRVEQATYSKVLSVNQVFHILLSYLETKSWRTALAVGVPKRKGYVLKPLESTNGVR